MLLYEVVMEGADEEMLFLVGGHTIRFSHVEFGLITKLSFEPYSSDMEGTMRLRDSYFRGKPLYHCGR